MAHAVPPAYWGAARTILQGLGIRPTGTNLKLLVAWFVRERGWAGALATHNPIDSVLPVAGSYLLPGNTASVRIYPTLAIGLQADTDTLKASYYAPLRAALRASSPAEWFSADRAWSDALCGNPAGCGNPTTPQYLAGMRTIYDQLPQPPGAYLKPGPAGSGALIPNPVLLAALAVAGALVVMEVV